METRFNMENTNLVKTDNYTYSTDWKDQLTEYNGYNYTYDNIGNPIKIEKDNITYRTFTWEMGRRLKSMFVKGEGSNPNLEITYKYNEEGVRVEKSVKDLSTNKAETTKYKVQGIKVVEEEKGNNKIHYYYDVSNSLIGFKLNETNYYYEKTILNDIIGIVNEEGIKLVEYNYDAFGNITSIIDNSGIDLGNINSYKYKDYYYDLETGYYYLTSRYYNPEVRRFINADDIDVLSVDQGTVLEHNLYAYTLNNPINMVDDSGEIAWWAAAAIIGAVFDTSLYVIGQLVTGQKITAGGLFKSAIVGAASGVAFGGIGKAIKGSKPFIALQKTINRTKTVRRLIKVADKLKYSKTALAHLSSRPYMKSTIIIKEIMRSSKPVSDSSLKNGYKWIVSGSYNGKKGTWELVIDASTDTIVHFLFRT